METIESNLDYTLWHLAYSIGLALHHFGCKLTSICSTLRCLGLDDTVPWVSEHIENDEIMKYLAQPFHADSPQKTVRFGASNMTQFESTVTIDYEDGLPVKLDIRCSSLPDFAMSIVPFVMAADGRNIRMDCLPKQVLCRIANNPPVNDPQVLDSIAEESR